MYFKRFYSFCFGIYSFFPFCFNNRSARMSVASTWHFSSGIRANNFVSSHPKKLCICIQMYIITFIPNFMNLRLLYVACVARWKPITNNKQMSALTRFSGKKYSTEREREKKELIHCLLHLPTARVYYFYEFFVPFTSVFFSFSLVFFWLGTNLIWGWKV